MDEGGHLFLMATIRPRPDRREEAHRTLESMRRSSVAEPGCLFMHLTTPQDDDDVWVMVEGFASRAAWDEHMATPHNVQGNEALVGLLAEPTQLRLLDELPARDQLPD